MFFNHYTVFVCRCGFSSKESFTEAALTGVSPVTEQCILSTMGSHTTTASLNKCQFRKELPFNQFLECSIASTLLIDRIGMRANLAIVSHCKLSVGLGIPLVVPPLTLL